MHELGVQSTQVTPRAVTSRSNDDLQAPHLNNRLYEIERAIPTATIRTADGVVTLDTRRLRELAPCFAG